jgi:hypothetical protein
MTRVITSKTSKMVIDVHVGGQKCLGPSTFNNKRLPPGVKFALGVNLSHRGDVCYLGRVSFTPSFTPRVSCLEER